MKASGFSLERVKINEARTQESTCYTADILFEGERVGRAENEGTGGMDMALFADRDHRDIFEAAANDAYPDVNFFTASDRLMCDLFCEAVEAGRLA